MVTQLCAVLTVAVTYAMYTYVLSSIGLLLISLRHAMQGVIVDKQPEALLIVQR